MGLLDSIIGGIGAVGGALSGIGNTVIGGINTAMQQEQNRIANEYAEKNYQNQLQQQQYQKDMQQQSWAREDNSVQRRVADLKAAGLSPILAAGSAASSSAPISINAPQREYVQKPPINKIDWDPAQTAQMVLAMMQQQADISRTAAQEKLLELQAAQTGASTHQTNVDTAIKSRDAQYMWSMGLPSNASTESRESAELAKQFSEAAGPAGGVVARIAKTALDTINKMPMGKVVGPAAKTVGRSVGPVLKQVVPRASQFTEKALKFAKGLVRIK